MIRRLFNYTYHQSNCKYSTSSSISPNLLSAISRDSFRKRRHLTFGEMFKQSKLAIDSKSCSTEFLIKSGEFVRVEAIVRMSKLIQQLISLPYGVAETDSINSVINGYISTYLIIKKIEKIERIEDLENHYQICRKFLLQHLLTIPKISFGLLQKSNINIETCPYLNNFIDDFAKQRVALRILTGHYMACYDQINNINNKNTHSNFNGLFEENCDIIKYIEDAIYDSQVAAIKHYKIDIFDIPTVKIHDKRTYIRNNFTYLPEHLHHIIFELLKNSMRAMIESNPWNDSIDIIIINDSFGSISIKISDIGGGISRENMNKIWSYSYTTAYGESDKYQKQLSLYGNVIQNTENEYKNNINIEFDRSVLGAVKDVPMFGLGYGLPISKVYAEYYGGSCILQSINGYGTDAYLYLNNLKDSAVVF